MKIKFFGVGAALNENMDNTYFLIEEWENKLQVDCGGWLGLAQSVKRWENHFENLFITHCHTDHFLWFFHLIRVIWTKIPKLKIFCSKNVENNIREVSRLIMWKKRDLMLSDWTITFINNDDLLKQNIWDFEIEPINLHSKKMIQFWFILKYNWKKIVFFWDEAISVLERDDLEKMQGADYLICEWLIPENQSIAWWGKFDLEKICHISARQSWRIAKKLWVKNLIIIHTKEQKNSTELLKNDAKLEFSWNIIVPKDGEEIELVEI